MAGKRSGALEASNDCDAFIIGITSLARAIDETGALGRRAALLTRLTANIVHMSEGERRKLELLSVVLEGVSDKENP